MSQFALTAYPMHGQHKLSSEGYRTRDGHLIEWFGGLLPTSVQVNSRPEPALLAAITAATSRRRAHVADNTVGRTALSWAIPKPSDRRAWWIQSLGRYEGFRDEPTPVISWNPFVALSNAWPQIAQSRLPFVFDLLDDWMIHYAFETIRPQVRDAYQRVFDHASAVTANSEATLQLARSFGRDDAQLVLNGCDPEKFHHTSLASGRTKVGYVGKIGKRVDLDLVLTAAGALPHVDFVFAGPILDSEYRGPLESQSNIRLLGDVHYTEVPALLQTFDIGWVPHRVGEGEVGGDVIKTYEYRASWLPVLTTPVLGTADRGMPGVIVAPATNQVDVLRTMMKNADRVPREPAAIPDSMTWRFKARHMLGLLGFESL